MTSLCQKCRAELGHEQKEVSSHEDVWKELLRLRIKVDILEKAITQMDKKVQKMNNRNLYWLIPTLLIVGCIIGIAFYGHLQINENQYMFDIAMSCVEELYNISVII